MNNSTRPPSAYSPLKDGRDLNAFTYFDSSLGSMHSATEDPGPTSARLDQPLATFSLGIKDNIEVAGMPCSCGTPSLRNYMPKFDAPAVARLRAAGSTIVGKTNMHELAYGITSNNAAFGPVRNAFDPNCFAGGSSGGTAVAIAAGVVRAGLGTDTGGSSRIPAALNGIVGFRPSMGRYPMDGVARISPTRDVIGPMGRDVKDVALLDSILAGSANGGLPAIDLRGLRLALPRQHFQEGLHADVRSALESVVARLREAGVVLIETDLPNIAALNTAVSLPVCIHETKGALQRFLQDAGLELTVEELHASIASPDVKALVGLSLSGHFSSEAYQRAIEYHRPRLQQAYRDFFCTHRIEGILFPTTPLPACPIEGSDETVILNGTRVPTFETFIRNTDPASNAGIPAISLPTGVSSGLLPLGIELDAPEGTDRRLLAIAVAIEVVLNN
jgi:mandelamide amidase